MRLNVRLQGDLQAYQGNTIAQRAIEGTETMNVRNVSFKDATGKAYSYKSAVSPKSFVTWLRKFSRTLKRLRLKV